MCWSGRITSSRHQTVSPACFNSWTSAISRKQRSAKSLTAASLIGFCRAVAVQARKDWLFFLAEWRRSEREEVQMSNERSRIAREGLGTWHQVAVTVVTPTSALSEAGDPAVPPFTSTWQLHSGQVMPM